MPKVKSRKRKTPIASSSSSTSSKTSKTSSSKPQATRTVIREFHVLLKRQTFLQKRLSQQGTSAQHADIRKELEEIEQRIEELGGLEGYQRMSAIGQNEDRGGGSHKLFIEWMKEEGVHEIKGKEKLQLLEVGALKPDNYASVSSWISVSPIDLNSRHPQIHKQDFLLLPPSENLGKWDAISLSLVLNFVPDAKDRGKMLRLCWDFLKEDGLLFIALPLPCLSNSRYLDFSHFTFLMHEVGFAQLKEKWKATGKMAYYLYRKTTQGQNSHLTPEDKRQLFSKKEVLRTGNRNNFCILLEF
ncbi:nucleolus protein [Coprinopsis sp. MPI-PUGE-AT-0042]|nr:nucleolus protein [Coprinopsis sp. MPI-PUGE-AT-0042]